LVSEGRLPVAGAAADDQELPGEKRPDTIGDVELSFADGTKTTFPCNQKVAGFIIRVYDSLKASFEPPAYIIKGKSSKKECKAEKGLSQ